MQLRSIVELLGCEVLCSREALGVDVPSCFAADLMSDVLAFATPNALLVTGLTSVQAVHTADVAECAAILFVGAKRPSREALELAERRAIPLLSTSHSMFEACGVLRAAGIPPARKA